MKKPVATIILNRNLPAVADRLYERIQSTDSDITDLYIVESGSSANNLSKHCTWWANWDESLAHGLRYPRGFNFALSKLLEEGKYANYDHFFLVCNDIEFELGKPVVAPLLEEMNAHKKVGILSPCSHHWGERHLLGPDETKYFWYANHTAWMLRREYVDQVREVENPNYMNFLYDGSNFRGYESEIEIIVKGYINDWAMAITSKVYADENKSHLITKADLIKTETFEETLVASVNEGKKWMRRKYGFNSRWSMQMYAKFFYEAYFENYPFLRKYKI